MTRVPALTSTRTLVKVSLCGTTPESLPSWPEDARPTVELSIPGRHRGRTGGSRAPRKTRCEVGPSRRAPASAQDIRSETRRFVLQVRNQAERVGGDRSHTRSRMGDLRSLCQDTKDEVTGSGYAASGRVGLPIGGDHRGGVLRQRFARFSSPKTALDQLKPSGTLSDSGSRTRRLNERA
jgi:hypothetical protein